MLELETIDTDGGETAERPLGAAMAQVKDHRYASVPRQSGADPVWLWAAVFHGKRIWARVERGEGAT